MRKKFVGLLAFVLTLVVSASSFTMAAETMFVTIENEAGFVLVIEQEPSSEPNMGATWQDPVTCDGSGGGRICRLCRCFWGCWIGCWMCPAWPGCGLW
ncbi:MAG: hypothetical protein FWE21_07480 [Defluviitaleaceae bacterium]|nr:hypothetical protein [Defluviitaleaceae bacterium]